MSGPILSFICWNRGGLTARNLNALLKTTDDFELHIIDSNSQDNTWKFVETLNDSRIVEKKKLDLNRGAPYAVNYVLSQRKKGQFFTHIDSDTYLLTPDWITRFMKIMSIYPEVGVACTVESVILNYFKTLVPFTKMERNAVTIDVCERFFAGNCVCIRPECIEKIGYFNEETARCDSDYAERILVGTNYKMAFVPEIIIDQTQKIDCSECLMSKFCKEKEGNCFKIRDSKYQHVTYGKKTEDIYNKYLLDIKSGKRSPYCASIHDKESMKKNYYNREIAEKNFRYFIENAN